MGLEVFYKRDVINALLAAEQATAAAGADGRYLEGYRAALTTVALAFGLVGRDDDQAGLPRLTNTWRPVVALGQGL